jgi:ribosomal-protein-alanine N-acetyltransferase
MAERVFIRPGRRSDELQFLAAVEKSGALHHPWVKAPSTRAAFRNYLARHDGVRGAGFFIWLREPQTLVGVVNLSEIVRGVFKSAYLGYYAFAPFHGRGLMHGGLSQVISHAFQAMKLHRLEANIQPRNTRSKSLVRQLGFRCEGFSPRYLKVNGRWRDHERWALLSEEW